MIEIKKKEQCSGCGACRNVCPRNCITMVDDAEGFAYPQVNAENCIDCHLCEKVCPILNPTQECACKHPIVLSAKADDVVRSQSSSGGIFALLAKHIIQQNGVVFGAVFDKDFNVVHTCATNEEGILPMMGSKYVQSDTNETFSKVKELIKDRKVLYVGTPCQIEGLLSFLRYKNIENLYTVDFVCHGIPSSKVWRIYLKERETEFGKKTENAFHRDKRHGWKAFSMTLQSSSMRYSKILTFDKYLQTFLRNYSLRPSCYHCPFKKIKRLNDITLADFWGIAKIRKGFDDDKGVSLVLIHSEKGQELFDGIKTDIQWNEESIDFVKRINHNMIKSVPKPANRDVFFKNIENYPFSLLYNKYIKQGFFYETKNTLKGILKVILHYMHYNY